MSYLIKDTTKQERIELIRSWVPDDEVMDGCDIDLWEMYRDYIDGKREVSNFDFREDFPVIGDENIIYKAEKEQKLYQWNQNINKYEPLDNVDVDIDIGDIDIISGGDAIELLRV